VSRSAFSGVPARRVLPTSTHARTHAHTYVRSSYPTSCCASILACSVTRHTSSRRRCSESATVLYRNGAHFDKPRLRSVFCERAPRHTACEGALKANTCVSPPTFEPAELRESCFSFRRCFFSTSFRAFCISNARRNIHDSRTRDYSRETPG